jgi:hypothetical protein
MNAIAVGMAAGALVVSVSVWALYLATIPGGRVPVRPVGSVVFQIVAIGLGVGAIAWSLREGDSPGGAVIAPSSVGVFMGGLFLFILSLRKTPVGELKVKVGDSLLPFSATTAEGLAFDSGALAGQRTLLKFFRGSW